VILVASGSTIAAGTSKLGRPRVVSGIVTLADLKDYGISKISYKKP
jgi:hypothetical protein